MWYLITHCTAKLTSSCITKHRLHGFNALLLFFFKVIDDSLPTHTQHFPWRSIPRQTTNESGASSFTYLLTESKVLGFLEILTHAQTLCTRLSFPPTKESLDSRLEPDPSFPQCWIYYVISKQKEGLGTLADCGTVECLHHIMVSFRGARRGHSPLPPLRIPTIHTHNIHAHVETSPLINIKSCLNRMFCSFLNLQVRAPRGRGHITLPHPSLGDKHSCNISKYCLLFFQ